MKRIGNILLTLLLCCSIFTKVEAQSADLDQRVSWEYFDVRLEDALSEISQKYSIRFSYSAYYIPVDRIVSTRVNSEPLGDALNDLFENTGVIYKSIGDQIVLRANDKSTQKRSISYNSKPQPSSPKETKREEEINTSTTSSTTTILTPVPKTREQSMPAELEDKDEYIFQAPKVAKEETNATRYEYHGRARSKIPQALTPVEIMPVTISDFAEDNGIRTKKGIEIDLTKYKAFVERIELRIEEQLDRTEQAAEKAWDNVTANLEEQKAKRQAKREERKLRKADKANDKRLTKTENETKEEEEQETTDEPIVEEEETKVNEEVFDEEREEELEERFVQVSLLPFVGTNFGKSRKVENKVSANVLWGVNGGVEGIEVGGLVNSVRRDVNGVQVAGLGNLVRGEVNGVQGAALLNVAGEGGKNIQVAGLVNYAGGNAGLQVAGLSNVSKDKVATAQISAFFNKATYVKGVQIGLINVVDSIGIAPIGLINIVKSGKNKYNKVELATSETFDGIVELKFGAKRLYNIIHGGYKWDQDANSWAIGFGLGTAF